MSKPKIKFIVNPNADMGNAWRQAADLRPILEEYGGTDWAGTVYPTHATELAYKAGMDGYDIVIAAGGDGTVHEVVNGLMQIPADKRPKLGVVPMGSGNDYAAALGLPDSSEKALKATLTGKTRKIDVGTIEDENGRKEFWDNTLSIGFGGAVTIFSHRMPVIRGFLMYFVAVVQTILLQYNVLKVTVETESDSWEDQVMLFAVCNGHREGGGFITAPKAVIDDGEMDYTIVKKVSRAKMFRLIPEFMNGTQEKFDDVYMGRAKKMTITSESPMFLHTDGEVFAGFENNIHKLILEIHPQAIEVLVPSEE